VLNEYQNRKKTSETFSDVLVVIPVEQLGVEICDQDSLWLCGTCRSYNDTFYEIQKRGMQQDLSWDSSAEQYEEVLLAAKYQW